MECCCYAVQVLYIDVLFAVKVIFLITVIFRFRYSIFVNNKVYIVKNFLYYSAPKNVIHIRGFVNESPLLFDRSKFSDKKSFHCPTLLQLSDPSD